MFIFPFSVQVSSGASVPYRIPAPIARASATRITGPVHAAGAPPRDRSPSAPTLNGSCDVAPVLLYRATETGKRRAATRRRWDPKRLHIVPKKFSQFLHRAIPLNLAQYHRGQRCPKNLERQVKSHQNHARGFPLLRNTEEQRPIHVPNRHELCDVENPAKPFPEMFCSMDGQHHQDVFN